jgi:hypothetical protein
VPSLTSRQLKSAGILGTFVLGGIFGCALGLGHGAHLPLAPAGGLFRSVGPAGQSGQPGGGLLPPLPPGLSLDGNGIIQGLELRVEPGTKGLSWDTLKSFEYSAAVGITRVPEALEAVDGQRVTMVGFLMPLYEFDDMEQFLLVGSHWSCCFGIPPGMNGAVNVTLEKGHAGMPNTMEPLKVVGTFRVKEVKEEGWLVSIYSLDDARAELIE